MVSAETKNFGTDDLTAFRAEESFCIITDVALFRKRKKRGWHENQKFRLTNANRAIIIIKHYEGCDARVLE